MEYGILVTCKKKIEADPAAVYSSSVFTTYLLCLCWSLIIATPEWNYNYYDAKWAHLDSHAWQDQWKQWKTLKVLLSVLGLR